MSRKHEKTTLREVALTAQVSEMTVSRVLRGKSNVSEATRERVLKTIDDLGFVPNKIAGALATMGSSNLIAVIIPSLKSQIFTEVLSGITSHLDDEGYKPVIGISDYEIEKEEELIQSMMSWRPAGLIISNNKHTEKAQRILMNAGIPIVEMMQVVDDPLDSCVGIVHEEAGALIARHFIKKGYREIGYVGWAAPNDTVQKRLTGFTETLKGSGVSVCDEITFDSPPDLELGKEAMRLLLDRRPNLDAIYFSNDVSAVGGLFHCMSTGISVPDDVAIAGFSGLQLGQILPQPLTTVKLARFEIGSTSAKIITDRIKGTNPARVQTMGIEFIEGATA